MTKNHDADSARPQPRGRKIVDEFATKPIHYPDPHAHTPEQFNPNMPVPEPSHRVEGEFPVLDGAKGPDSGDAVGTWRHTE